ncbi:hypothetical protein [Lactobacillus sp. ESL0677]|uniref:hypothetical protein n=1 Tax=Lactobacillus sp. ESL0677 TaxID=2983208 RepID=UPI0023F92735|nr:hypothetical protein [Lactobacillus sp. ESL0677]WEV36981.1 hypothetical protein OZX76_09655 [Lactobacillus sp. ESL0677]
MTNKTNTDDLTSLVNTIIKDNSYPCDNELSAKEKEALIIKLKKLNKNSDNLNEILRIVNAFYKDKIARQLKSIDINSSLIFEMLQHEVVSATRLHAFLLDLAEQEGFSTKGIEKINHYFIETNDYGNNTDFITMSSFDVIDAIRRTKSDYLEHDPQIFKRQCSQHVDCTLKSTDGKKKINNIIKLSDY